MEGKVSSFLLTSFSPLIFLQSGHTLLHAAVMGCLPGALRSLLVRLRVQSDGRSKVGNLINHKDDDCRTALHIAASKGLKVHLILSLQNKFTKIKFLIWFGVEGWGGGWRYLDSYGDTIAQDNLEILLF